MTRKDYILIAASVNRSRMASGISGAAPIKAAKDSALHLGAIDLAASLKHDNPNFDRERFMVACGF
jgi:hypothetical protein